jgi:hypothetical protein
LFCKRRKRRFAGHAKESEICFYKLKRYLTGAGERDYIEPHRKESWVEKKKKIVNDALSTMDSLASETERFFRDSYFAAALSLALR